MKRFYLLFALSVFSLGVSAQSLEECRSLAKEHYPEISQYDLISKTEEYNLSNATRAWIPQIMVSGQASYQSATPTYPEVLRNMLLNNGLDMVGVAKDQYKIAIDLNQNIWDGGQSKANRSIAEAEAEEQRSRVDVSLYDLQSRVDNIYFGILLLDERREQTNALIGMLESNLNRMRSYFMNGVAMQSDVDAIEAELLSAKQTLVQVESSRASYRQMLEIFIGQPLKDEILKRPEMCEVTNRSSLRPELELFDAQQNKFNAQEKAITSSVMPQFSIFAQGYYGYPGLDMFKGMVTEDWSLNGIIGVRMMWNVSAFYTKKNNVEKLNIAKKQIDVQRDVFMFNTQLQTTQYDGEIIRLKRAINDDKRIVELRSRIRMAAESQLTNGIIDTTDLLRKITDETNAILNCSTHEIELLQATYNLKNTLNQ